MPEVGASDVWERARTYLQRLQDAESAPTVAGHDYVKAFPNHPPDVFQDSTRRRKHQVRRALGDGDGWACRLSSCVAELHVYSLHAEHVGLPEVAASPERLFDPSNVRQWREAIKATLSGPLYWVLELGECGRVHAHVLGGATAGLPHIRRGGGVVTPVHDLEGLLSYLSKPVAPYTGPNMALWLAAKRRGRLPKMSGTVRLPNARTWGCPKPNLVPSARTFVSTPLEPLKSFGERASTKRAASHTSGALAGSRCRTSALTITRAARPLVAFARGVRRSAGEHRPANPPALGGAPP